MRGYVVKRTSKKDGKPLYYTVVQGKWHAVPGKRTKANAEAYCGELIARYHQGDRLGIERIGFEAFTEKWLTNVASGLSVNSQNTYRVWLKNQLIPFFGSQLVSSIRAEDVQRFKATSLKSLSA